MARRTDTKALAAAEPRPILELDGHPVELLQLYDRYDWRRGTQPGVWSQEPGKIAWRDEGTGYDCIIRRETTSCLGGYVGVDQSHPLFGYGHRALAHGFDIEVHGGLAYSRVCDEHGPEEVRICHADELAPSHTQMWWFGFHCDHSYDLLPADAGSGMSGEAGRYRDIHYLYRQTVQLAAQLEAIAAGAPKPAITCAPPPLCLDHRDMGATW